MSEFGKEIAARIAAVPEDKDLCKTARDFTLGSIKSKYSYNLKRGFKSEVHHLTW